MKRKDSVDIIAQLEADIRKAIKDLAKLNLELHEGDMDAAMEDAAEIINDVLDNVQL